MDPAGAVFLAGIGIRVLTMPLARFRAVQEELAGLSGADGRHPANAALGWLDADLPIVALGAARLSRALSEGATLSL